MLFLKTDGQNYCALLPGLRNAYQLLEKSAKQKNSIFVFHDLHFMLITLYYFS